MLFLTGEIPHGFWLSAGWWDWIHRNVGSIPQSYESVGKSWSYVFSMNLFLYLSLSFSSISTSLLSNYVRNLMQNVNSSISNLIATNTKRCSSIHRHSKPIEMYAPEKHTIIQFCRWYLVI